MIDLHECKGLPAAMVLPPGHGLPKIMAQWPYYGWNFPRVSCVLSAIYREACIIDIGANVGDTAAMLRSVCECPVLCVEGVQEYLEYLAKNTQNLSGVEIFKGYVSTGSSATAISTVVRCGTASAAGRCKDGERVNVFSLESIVQAHPRFENAKLIKIDTDGQDCDIIIAARAFLKRVKPVIFFEYDPHLAQGDAAIAVWCYLQEMGYSSAVAWDNYGYYMGGYDLSDELTGPDLYSVAAGWNTERYLDVCVFHKDDLVAAQMVRRHESELSCTMPKSLYTNSAPDHYAPTGIRAASRLLFKALFAWPATKLT